MPSIVQLFSIYLLQMSSQPPTLVTATAKNLRGGSEGENKKVRDQG